MKVLVTGISGKLGRVVTHRLLERGHEVAGVDRRPWPNAPKGVQVVEADIRKRNAEDVFRTFRPEGVIHMATVTHLLDKSPERYRINLQGTRAVVDACAEYRVSQLVFVGRHTFYGAAPDSPLYHTEDEPPLALSFTELADLVAADLFAASALWRHPELSTSVLRMVYTLGPSRHGTLASFLRGPRVPTVLGFDPLFQFLHDSDAANAVVLALEKSLRGVFNVAGPGPLPLSVLIDQTNRQAVPVPEALLNLTFGRFGLPKLPKGAIEHLKYPIVVDASAFKAATGFVAEHDEQQAMAAFTDAAGNSFGV